MIKFQNLPAKNNISSTRHASKNGKTDMVKLVQFALTKKDNEENII